MRLVPRNGSDKWELRMGVHDINYNIKMNNLVDVKPNVTGHHLVYNHTNFSSWYVNTQQGLELGFDIKRPPDKRRIGEHFVMRIAVEGNLQLRNGTEENIIEFAQDNGSTKLMLSKLKVKDAFGHVLPSRMVINKREPQIIEIHVNDRNAKYPLNVDPLLTNTLVQEDIGFGITVATAGDINGDGFSDIVVGAPYFDGGMFDSGIALLYPGSAERISGHHIWKVIGETFSAHLGHSVSTAGDVNGDGLSDIIVGAPRTRLQNVEMGRVYVFHGREDGPRPEADFLVTGPTDLGLFGWSVSTAGDVDLSLIHI